MTSVGLRLVAVAAARFTEIPAGIIDWLEEATPLERSLDLALALLVDELSDRHVQHPLTSSSAIS